MQNSIPIIVCPECGHLVHRDSFEEHQRLERLYNEQIIEQEEQFRKDEQND